MPTTTHRTWPLVAACVIGTLGLASCSLGGEVTQPGDVATAAATSTLGTSTPAASTLDPAASSAQPAGSPAPAIGTGARPKLEVRGGAGSTARATKPTLDSSRVAPLPAVAATRTDEGAGAFAQYYVEQFNRAAQDARQSLHGGYSKECDTCLNFIYHLAGQYERGELADARPFPISAPTAVSASPDGLRTVKIPVAAGRFNYIVSSGKKTGSGYIDKSLMTVQVRWTDAREPAGWEIQDIDIEATP